MDDILFFKEKQYRNNTTNSVVNVVAMGFLFLARKLQEKMTPGSTGTEYRQWMDAERPRGCTRVRFEFVLPQASGGEWIRF